MTVIQGGEEKGATGTSARQHQLAAMVVDRGSVRIEELAERAQVSAMTIYRDLATLEEAGILQRQHGLAVAVVSGLHEASLGFRMSHLANEKMAMAASVAPRIAPGSSLALDDSSSCLWLLRALKDVTALTVSTYCLRAAREVQEWPNPRLFVTGGEYQPWSEAMLGPSTIEAISAMQYDVCTISASAVANGRCLHHNEAEAAVKRAMLAQSTLKVLIADHTKFTRTALHVVADLCDLDLVVVDAATPEPLCERIRAAGVELLVAQA